jgi:hypothetical protein
VSFDYGYLLVCLWIKVQDLFGTSAIFFPSPSPPSLLLLLFSLGLFGELKVFVVLRAWLVISKRKQPIFILRFLKFVLLFALAIKERKVQIGGKWGSVAVRRKRYWI